jgi:two-component system, OmpR family, response regulator
MDVNKRLKVLYVEDNEDAGVMLSILLGFSNIDVSLARSVTEAFQSAESKPFDLFLLNSRFPEGNGYELCQKLRQLKPQTPIVFYSGDAYEADKQKGFVAGANAYLTKPNIESIAQTIFQLVI